MNPSHSPLDMWSRDIYMNPSCLPGGACRCQLAVGGSRWVLFLCIFFLSWRTAPKKPTCLYYSVLETPVVLFSGKATLDEALTAPPRAQVWLTSAFFLFLVGSHCYLYAPSGVQTDSLLMTLWNEVYKSPLRVSQFDNFTHCAKKHFFVVVVVVVLVVSKFESSFPAKLCRRQWSRDVRETCIALCGPQHHLLKRTPKTWVLENRIIGSRCLLLLQRPWV